MVSGLYVGLGALLLFGLTVAVSRERARHRVMLGDGDVPSLRQAMRAHGNCAETLPILLLIVVAVEMAGAPAWVVHVFGVAAIVARALHAQGLLVTEGVSFGRFTGMILTVAVFFFGGLGLIGHQLL